MKMITTLNSGSGQSTRRRQGPIVQVLIQSKTLKKVCEYTLILNYLQLLLFFYFIHIKAVVSYCSYLHNLIFFKESLY